MMTADGKAVSQFRLVNPKVHVGYTAVLVFSKPKHFYYSMLNCLYAIARPSVYPSVRHTGGSVKIKNG